MVASSCTGGSDEQQTIRPVRGGTAAFGAARWPQCLNPLTACNLSGGYHATVGQLVFPKLMMLDRTNNYVASPVLAGQAPTLGNGMISLDPFTVTYRINPRAVWDDGSPITSADVRFTWRAILNTTGSDNLAGYDEIADIDTSNPKSAVISFKEPYAPWPDLFGGGNVNGYILKKSAFPNADNQKPNLRDGFEKGVPFSGGPWKLRSWKDDRAVLVRNDRYWGARALLDEITFVRMEEAPQAVAALSSGDASAIFFAEAPEASLAAELEQPRNVDYVSGPTNFGQALWLNLKEPPLNDLKVRQALAYAVDRQSIINRVVRLNNPRASVLQCLPPLLEIIGRWCDSSFARFGYNPQKSIQILESAGWDCSSKPCTKDGRKLSVVDYVPSGDRRGVATGRVIKETAVDAGFEIVVKENDATDLFANKMPRGEYQMADLSLGGVADPSQSLTATYHCDTVPTEANKFSGVNTSFWCNREASELMEGADREIREAKRAQMIKRIHGLLAKDVVAIPLYSVTAITAWRTDRIAGPVGAWNSAFYGPYFNVHQWFQPREGGDTARP